MDQRSRLDYPQYLDQLARRADAAMAEDVSAAREAALAELEAIRVWEREFGSRLHKGHALYNLGVIELGEDPLLARRRFLAAYVEDARTWLKKRPSGAVAGRVLHNLYGLTRAHFSKLARRARVAPDEDPEEVADAFEATALLPPVTFSIPRDSSRSASQLDPIPPERRVFLGGNYGRCPDRINNARQVIVEAGFEPVVVREFEYLRGEDGQERAKSFRLLDMCGLAVFETSEPGGWQPEVEHLAGGRAELPTLLQFASEEVRTRHPSSMLPTAATMPRIEHHSYRTSGEMRYNLLRWLSRHRGDAEPLVPREGLSVAWPSNTPTITTSGWSVPGTATRRPEDLV